MIRRTLMSGAFALAIAYSLSSKFPEGDLIMYVFASLIALLALGMCVAFLRCSDNALLLFLERVLRVRIP